ncbi:hypothetical protein CDAR_400501 [Caerostris darwini]|uniref:Uncharacterized protein n=1 Tax=Caerostris darwini TaxID=1538125 RepID=A0AAV4P996_9ARAC|nr:hypothetical protein CDAR_400501 [Caerostris darwini]
MAVGAAPAISHRSAAAVVPKCRPKTVLAPLGAAPINAPCRKSSPAYVDQYGCLAISSRRSRSEAQLQRSAADLQQHTTHPGTWCQHLHCLKMWLRAPHSWGPRCVVGCWSLMAKPAVRWLVLVSALAESTSLQHAWLGASTQLSGLH